MPAFQAIIPDILKDERDYTKALSLSRLAHDLENRISPALAGLPLAVLSYIGCLAAGPDRFFERLTRNARICMATPRLRGLLALNLTTVATGAFVIVNTVVIVRAGFMAVVPC